MLKPHRLGHVHRRVVKAAGVGQPGALKRAGQWAFR